MATQTPNRIRLYSPGAIASFALLAGLGVAMLLLGLNVYRRGGKLLGAGMAVLAALAVVREASLLWLGMGGITTPRLWMAAPFAIGVMRLEAPLYQQALTRGAKPASWWPPTLLSLSLLALLVLGM